MKINVIISDDEKEARLIVERSEDDTEFPIVEDLKDALTNAGVTAGIDDLQLSYICFEQKFNIEVVVAKYIGPRIGEDAKIEEVNVPKPPNKIQPVMSKDGKIDYIAPRKGYMVFLRKGGTIIRRVSPTIGRSGRTVRGKEIQGTKGKDLFLGQFSGTNTEIKDDSIVAKTDGIVKFVDNRYVVENECKINSNVGLETGSIIIPKDSGVVLEIEGDIKNGYEVVCSTLKVGGCVEDARIEVENLAISKGIVGTSDRPIVSKFIKVGYVNGPRRIFANYVKVLREISNGAVVTADIVQANTIQGSTVMAKEGIWADYINGYNDIYIGIDYDVKKEFDKVAKEIIVMEGEISSMKEEFIIMSKKMEKMKKLAEINPKNPVIAKEILKIKEFRGKYDSRVEYRNNLVEQKYKLAERMYIFDNNFLLVKNGFSPDTSTEQIIDPDTNLHICTHNLKITEPTSGSLFKADREKINVFKKFNITEYKNIIDNKFKSFQ